MNYHNITTDDMLNGDGLRVVLWVSGCNHFCPYCQNPETHNPLSGIKFDEEAKQELIEKLKPDYIQGLTLSGGDPLFPENRAKIYSLCKEIKEIYPNKDIWCYTGYLYEEVKDLLLIKYIDVLVDGPYIEKLKDINYKWAGSTNQRVIILK